ncbi:GumC family protein [Stenomitos frigidus]|uniref:Lipopolysaccharide biosynthesis protein n=1 Tax=Stenomitos frigidus ULC18 TaxID=2107698 RepID=A0A2T1ECZ2_9CYAN|nr:hypothetical protein [Stenomitos frigidus]PSB30600.1 hypothetical protein C7B82_08635 [Stenomitos frigidus ULC18]
MQTFLRLMTGVFNKSEYVQTSTKPQVHYLPYLLAGISASAIMWSLAFFYVSKTRPTYASDWTLTLPGTTANTKLNLPDTGTASTEQISPYANPAQDPRENYKFIATSEAVQQKAAAQLNMTSKELGQPRIKIVNNTTLMSFSISGASPGEAQKKSFAFYKAFQSRLNELRNQEVIQREEKALRALDSAHTKLADAQRRVAEYQIRSGLASATQIEQLSNAIEELRKKRAEGIAQLKQTGARFRQLSTDLDISTSQASDAFMLKSDQIFQRHLKDYTTSTANMALLASRYTPQSPSVAREQSKLDAVKVALLERSRSVLGHSMNETTLAQLNIGSGEQPSTARELLFKDIVTAQAEQQGFQAYVQALDQQVAEFEARLTISAQSGSKLEALKREYRLYEAVFSSTLANSDLGKSALTSSYPEVQLLAEPSLSDIPVSPKKKLVFLGTAVSSLLTATGLMLIFSYKRRGIELANKKVAGVKQIANYEASEL